MTGVQTCALPILLAIGGFKEKSLAARRAGIKKIIFPYDNLKDLEDIPDVIKKAIEFVPVKTMDEVLEHALISKPTPSPDASGKDHGKDGGKVKAKPTPKSKATASNREEH